MAFTNGKTAENMKVTTILTKSMATALILIQMAAAIQDSGLKVSCME